ncbi:hypothetical protein PV326_003200 [Microctonus aethiopoides]|nr:hypothetical protein PV326_003200 [Microctonus aethiopoides]
MWNYICVSGFFLTVSFLYHYYTTIQPLSVIQYPKENYDYIVVGAGTAGCVIASRLSESPNTTVLLIEAGGYFNWLTTVPLAAPLMQSTNVDWSYKTESQYYSSRALKNYQQFWPRGKGLGGSGQLNYLVHSFGIADDYKDWPSGWSYADLQPYFRKVSSIMSLPGTEPDGPLLDALIRIDTTLFNGKVTIEKAKNTIKRGGRWSTFNAYLQNAWNRENFHILTDTLVTKILFNNETSVEGIKVRFASENYKIINVNRELIVCAGAIGSPHLMMVSGIGPFDQLQSNRVPIIRNIPQIGKNLYDHLNLPMYVNLKMPVSITLRKIQTIAELIKYFIFETGLLATNGIIGNIVRNNSSVVLFGVGSVDEKLLKDVANFKTEGFLYLINCLKPRSRGNITLVSDSILDPPKIDPAYLEYSEDILCTQDGIRLALEVLNTESFRKLGAHVHLPNIKECRHFHQDYYNPDYSECIIRYAALTGHHPGGTCRMGVDNDSVVNDKLMVNGVKKLRIVDASIIPNPISGTPNSVIIAIAERAADIIRGN